MKIMADSLVAKYTFMRLNPSHIPSDLVIPTVILKKKAKY